MHASAALLIAVVVWATPSSAQVPQPAPTPTAPTASPAPPPAAGTPTPAPGTGQVVPAPVPPEFALPAPGTPAAAAKTCTFDEPCVRADRNGYDKGLFWFEGFVDIRAGDVRIQADRVEILESQAAGAPASRVLTALGNVVFLRDEERLSGEKLSLDLASGRGTFEQAAGYMEPGVFIEGRRIERLATDRYRIDGGRFTSCSQPNPRWSFSTASATLRIDDKIKASHVVFKVKSVPAFYLPYLVYPIGGDQRSTGILFPHFGYSSLRGFNLGTGFFWAMGRSADQTFYLDHYSRFGQGYGHELRYVRDASSRGSFRSYAFRPQDGGELDYDLDWNALQMLPGRARATLGVRLYSDLLFQRQIQDNPDAASTRQQIARFNVQKSFRGTVAQITAEANDTFFSDTEKRVNRRLPSARVSRRSQRLGRGGPTFSYDLRADYLQRGNQDRVDSYSRFDAAPSLSLPLAASFLQLTPRVATRYTRYGASLDNRNRPLGPPVDRRYVEAGVELVGPTFARIFDTPGNFYSARYKHLIGPEVSWAYRSRIDEFDRIPFFDGADRLLGTHEVSYGIVQRLFAKRPGPGGRLAPYEFLTWSVRQTYYVNIAEGQNEFDPNYLSTAFGPGSLPDHNSPISSQLRLRPTPNAWANFDLEYDVNFRQVRSFGLSTSVSGARGSLEANWSRSAQPRAGAPRLTVTANTLRGSASFQVLPRRLTLSGGANYELLTKTLRDTRAQARLDVQCCGFMVEWIRYSLLGRQERQFRFSIELANVGSMGNFMGEEDRRLGLGGMR